VQWVQGPDTTQPVAITASGRVPIVARSVKLGFLHIVPRGLDHILFVAGLALAGTGRRRLALLVTAFTLAHSLTLGLSLYGVFSLPSQAVEPLIALSVAYVGLEHAINASLERARIAVVFGFGLLHGLGFAEALAGLHLPRTAFATMLVSFNLGVEAGQLTVLAGVLAALWLLARSPRVRGWPVRRLAAATVGLTGVIWTVERVL
jgi:hydrogenase/urease accessory protein HupE